MMKCSFSRFKNTAANPILLDDDDSIEELPLPVELHQPNQTQMPALEIMVIGEITLNPTVSVQGDIMRNTHTTSDEVVEVLMKELTMDEKSISSHQFEDIFSDGKKAENQGGVKNKGKSPVMEEKKPKKLKSEPTTYGDHDFVCDSPIIIGSSAHTIRSSSKLRQMTAGSSCKLEKPIQPARDLSKKTESKIKLEGGGKDSSMRSIKKGNTGARHTPISFRSSGSKRRRPRLSNLKTRTSPKTLYETISGLNTAQKEALKDIGLKSFLEMRLDGIPSKLGFFIIDRLDTTRMQIETPSGNIGISVDSVNRVLGLPLRGIDLVHSDVVSYGLKLMKQWRKQFKKISIRPSDVVTQIKQSDDTGFMFKINMLVLFVNLMGDCNIMGTCNVHFLSRIKSEAMISNIDWCRYIFEKVRTSKLRWRRYNDMCFYTGPLSFLTLLYIEATESETESASKGKQPLNVWHIGLLRNREAKEIKDGGFGLLPIKEAFKVKHVMDEGECSIKRCSSDNELGKQELIELIQLKVKSLVDAKVDGEKLIETAISKFPDDETFTKLKNEFASLFGIGQPSTRQEHEPRLASETREYHNEVDVDKLEKVVSRVDETANLFDACWDSPKFVAAVCESERLEVERSEIRKSLSMSSSKEYEPDPLEEVKRSEERKSLSMSSSKEYEPDPLDFDLGISPEKNDKSSGSGPRGTIIQSALKTSTGCSSKDKGKKVVTFLPIPIASFEDDESEVNIPADTSKPNGRESRRNVKLGDHLRSPYVVRCVDFQVSYDEKRMHEFIMADFGGKYDYVFWGYDNTRLTRVGMETLASNTSVDKRVLDCWATVLNYEERYRNRDSPRRFFFNTNVMADLELSSRNLSMTKTYNDFKRNLIAGAKGNNEAIRMKDLDLVFFPLMKGEHKYVVVFNLKNPNVFIIDNMYAKPTDDDTMMKSYNYETDILEMLMIEHLRSVGHPAGDILDGEGQERLQMEWQTPNNFEDSGVYAMRVMETFMGDTKNWKVGFDIVEQKQRSQINILKMKYVSKMLMSNSNKHRDRVKKEVATFFSMPINARETILQKARANRWERMNS